MEHGGKSFPEAIEELARDAGLAVPRVESRPGETERREQADDLASLLLQAAKFYRAQLKESPRAIDYLKGRGLTGEIAARFGIGYAPDAWQPLAATFEQYDARELETAGLVIAGEAGKRYDRFRDRIMFPIHDSRGQVIGFGGRVLGDGEPKYLNSPETPLFSKGRELYGLYLARNAIRAAARVVVVEGYMDVVALAQHGIDYAVATLGTATTPVHAQKLFRLADTVVYCFDGDAAGTEGSLARAREHAAGAGRRPQRAVPLPARWRGSRRLRAQARQGRVRGAVRARYAAVRIPDRRAVGAAPADLGRRTRRARPCGSAAPRAAVVSAGAGGAASSPPRGAHRPARNRAPRTPPGIRAAGATGRQTPRRYGPPTPSAGRRPSRGRRPRSSAN